MNEDRISQMEEWLLKAKAQKTDSLLQWRSAVPGIDAGLNLAVDKLLDAVLRRDDEEDGAAMDLQRPDRFETR